MTALDHVRLFVGERESVCPCHKPPFDEDDAAGLLCTQNPY